MLFGDRNAGSPSTDDNLEVIWLGRTMHTGCSPRQFLTYRELVDRVDDDFAEQQRRGKLANPVLSKNYCKVWLTRTLGRTNPPASRNISPRLQREIDRLDEYHRSRKSKQSIRRILKVIQDKRREEFRVLCEALSEVYHYAGPHLQRLGEKAAAAHLIRTGGLGAEFIGIFDDKAKWKWLQIRVNGMAYRV
ncbi:hypothetical protein DFH28DRAFT_1118623 [Melampsora americana]|nr:hypothetical protein DFH28DRAFT_1118623 [Melampsora americana]